MVHEANNLFLWLTGIMYLLRFLYFTLVCKVVCHDTAREIYGTCCLWVLRLHDDVCSRSRNMWHSITWEYKNNRAVSDGVLTFQILCLHHNRVPLIQVYPKFVRCFGEYSAAIYHVTRPMIQLGRKSCTQSGAHLKVLGLIEMCWN
jgi:hypothetical protein